MQKNKKVLLIGGGGTLGSYTGKELLRLGFSVDVICLEDRKTQNPRLRFYRETATETFLEELLRKNSYDGIVNFIHYPEVKDYRPVHQLLSENTDHLIFLSSYRVYGDLEHPITENAPQLVDIVEDKDFLEHEKYAVSKARAEQFLREESNTVNWTIVRPVISFSQRRFDLVTRSGREILKLAEQGRTITLPKECRQLTAGLDWAGNSGRLIANLLFKEETLGEAYTISTAQNLTWGQVAEFYAELLEAKIVWVNMEEYLKDTGEAKAPWGLKYDRMFDRVIDNSKVMKVTGFRNEDFLSIKEGIRMELSLINDRKEQIPCL